MHVDIDEDELPDGWIVSSNHSSHVGITRGDDPRHHVAAHPMAPQTDADGWFAHARPGTDKIVAEADPIEEVVDAMIAAAQQFEQTGEYKVNYPALLPRSLRRPRSLRAGLPPGWWFRPAPPCMSRGGCTAAVHKRGTVWFPARYSTVP
jgi:hypothetical protein